LIINLTLVSADGFSNISSSPSRGTLTGTSRFCPKKFVKDFFVPKKQKHEMRLTNSLAKNRLTGFIEFVFGYFASVPADGLKFSR